MKDDIDEIADRVFGHHAHKSPELRRRAKSIAFAFREYGDPEGSRIINIDELMDEKGLSPEQREKVTETLRQLPEFQGTVSGRMSWSKAHRPDTIVIDDVGPREGMADGQREKLQRMYEKMMRGPQPRGLAMTSPHAESIVEHYYREYPHLKHFRRPDGRYEQRRMDIHITGLVVQLALM